MGGQGALLYWDSGTPISLGIYDATSLPKRKWLIFSLSVAAFFVKGERRVSARLTRSVGALNLRGGNAECSPRV